VSIAEIVSAIREERLQDAVRMPMARECTVTVYARHVLRAELDERIALLAPWESAASLTHKLHALFGLTESAQPCGGCPERGGFCS
jgi:hypothetical protein